MAPAKLTNGEIVNYSKVGSDAQVSPRTVQNYYEVLSDTLIGSLLPAFQLRKSRKVTTTPKFYFFDIGIVNALQGRFYVPPKTAEYGRALEHLIFCELRAYLDYHRIKTKLSFWRTKTQLEVDFVIGNHAAIEVKATHKVRETDLYPLRMLNEETKLKYRFVIAQELGPRMTNDGIEIMPPDVFLAKLWQGKWDFSA